MNPFMEVKIYRAREFDASLVEKHKEAQQILLQRELKLQSRREAPEQRTKDMQEVMNENCIKHEEELCEESSWEAPTYTPKDGLWAKIAKELNS